MRVNFNDPDLGHPRTAPLEDNGEGIGAENFHTRSQSASHSGGWLKEALKQEETKVWDQYVARWPLPPLLFFPKYFHNSLTE